MSQPMIEVKNLGKKYRIGEKEKYLALRDKIAHPIKAIKSLREQKDFWALEDVNFTVEPGEVLGVIGRNGAGKSTLLKILSRITPPTTGEIKMRGRVGSLLEVGTGFHPELTGRENIFLSGSILGMRKKEIEKKFDEIVEFAGIEKFLDTPVKRYSSGMYVRLGFAIAAHLEPEILLIDEVLAVGDAEFQKKCLGKMGDITKNDGRTIIFVSHNMNAIENLCSRVILLDKGGIVGQGNGIREIIKQYLTQNSGDDSSSGIWVNSGKEFINPYFKPLKITLTNESGIKLNMPVRNDGEICFRVEGEVLDFDNSLTIGYAIFDEENNLLYWSYQTDVDEKKWLKVRKGKCILTSKIPKRFLNEGRYRIEFIGGLHNRQWLYEPTVSAPYVYLDIKGGLSDSPYWMNRRPGILAPVIEWEISQLK